MKHYTIISLLLLFHGGILWSQEPTDATGLAVRPLDELLADALQYSPILKAQQLDIDQLYVELDLLKKEWTNYVNFSGSFQVGNVQFIDNLSGGSSPDVRTVTRENIFAVAGLNVRLPLSDFITKSQRQELIDLKIEQQRLNLQRREMEIRELVIRQYNGLQKAVQVLEIRTRDVNFHEVTTEKVERFFREGSISLDEYTNAYNKRNEAEVRLAEAAVDAQLTYMLLREIVGRDIQQ